jgi:hypothetical protein
MSPATISDVLAFLERLKAAQIHYRISDHTQGAIMIEVAVPGERWEIEFHEDGRIGAEVFVSSNGVLGPEALQELFARFSD